MAAAQERIAGNDVASELRRAREQAGVVAELRAQLADQEQSWRAEYDKLARECEEMRSEASEAALAAQWRERYEQAAREREALSARLRLNAEALVDLGGGDGGGGGGGGRRRGSTGGAADAASDADELLRKYGDLKEEYKQYRRRAMAAIADKDAALSSAHADLSRGLGGSSGVPGGGGGGGGGSRAPARAGAASEDPRFEYLRNLMAQYLSQNEAGARSHIERAIVTVLQFSEQERRLIESRNAPGWFGGG